MAKKKVVQEETHDVSVTRGEGPGLDWVKIDYRVARDGTLSPNGKALYMALATYVDIDTRASDYRPPYRRELASCIGKSVSTVERSLVELREYRLLKIVNQYDEDNPKLLKASHYILLDGGWWARRVLERLEAAQQGR
ncbi:helix-turn-helix domain-containing protein [Streptomyces sp. RKAG337]|uniref:helix-turn-helix domain-containing protein n=1 Tax=Streptomyces sp. RKAG337 TaxID=2893404 RepID=UPI002033C25C|nr:helix-turn-helix domain-containing protein [Streptomyces sp. RKAG337]MCM2431065.1 helix-turn-helix domain-containing protein [Streptomyces sp. RKAG337]